jgi:Spy/CpxP family protein refolding chaperone
MRKSIVCAAFLGIGLLAGAVGVSAAAPATSASGGPEGKWGHGPIAHFLQARMGRAMTLRAELNLTDQQRDAIKTAMQSHKQEVVTAVKPVVDAKRALRDAVLAEKSDDSAIRKAADDLGKKVADAAVVIAKVKADVASKANLTPEQMKKIADFRAENDSSTDNLLKDLGSSAQ